MREKPPDIYDQYRGSKENPVEVPEHLQNYGPNQAYAEAQARRLSGEAKDVAEVASHYHFDELDRGALSVGYEGLYNDAATAETALNEALELAGVDISDSLKQLNHEGIRQDRDVIIQARVEEMLRDPPNASWREKRALRKRRKSLSQILSMEKYDYDALQKTWDQHEQALAASQIDRLQGEAFKEDRKLQAGEKMAEARADMAKIDSRYGRAIEQIRALPIDHKDLLAFTDEYQKTVKSSLDNEEIKQKLSKLNERHVDGTQRFVEALAIPRISELTKRLREGYEAEGLDEQLIQDKLKADSDSLRKWLLGSIAEGSNPQEDLKAYELHSNKLELWQKHRKKAVDFILLRTVENSNETSEQLPTVDLDREFTGFWVRNRNRAGLAKELSRHHNGLWKTAIYGSLVARFGGDSARTMWESIPEEKLEAARRKTLLKTTALGRFLAKRGKAAATGVWNRLNAESHYG